MKTLALTLAAAVMASSAAFADTLPAPAGLDFEATSSVNVNEVRTDEIVQSGNRFQIQYTLNADGSRDILHKVFKSSDG